jgi:hypothetical protein
MARQSVYDNWRERWWRRGELLAVAGFTAAVGSAATGRWMPFGVSLGAMCLGLYTVGAAESRLWLPGRRRVTELANIAAFLPEGGGTSADATAVVAELRRLNQLLHGFYELLAADSTTETVDGARSRRLTSSGSR